MNRHLSNTPTRRSTLRRGLVSLGAAAALVLAHAPSAAADYYPYGNGSTHFTTQIIGSTSTWTSRLNFGRTAWSSVSSISGTSSSNVKKAKDVAVTQPWLGLYTPSGTRAARSFTIQVNRTAISKASASSGVAVDLIAKGTATHEFGHALSLADNPTTSAASIMKYSTSLSRTTPYAYDFDGVRRYYGSLCSPTTQCPVSIPTSILKGSL